MTNPEYVHYVMIIDRSGSMQPVAEDFTGGCRSFIDRQLQGVDGNKRTVSLYQFDTVHEKIYDFDLLEKAKSYKLVPRGCTALLDACGRAITEVGEKLAIMPEHERPGYVMVLIVTDGAENASRMYTRAQVNDMIQHQQDKYGWRFTYLGANQDSFTEASHIGIDAPSVLSWVGTTRSVNNTWDVLAASCSAGTTATVNGIYYSQAQRDHATAAGS